MTLPEATLQKIGQRTSDITMNFLLCSERSGSNLIRVMLDAHSQIFAPGPTHLGRMLIPKLSRYGDLNIDSNFRRLAEDAVKVFNQRYSHYAYSVTADEIVEKARHRHFCAIYEYIFKKGMQLSQKRQVFMKENHNHQLVAYWLRYFPNAKFVFQVRDPRDFYLSAKKYRPFLTQYHSPWRTINTWKKDQEESRRVLLELGPKRVFFQRYEDLISNTEESLIRLCEFLEVPYEMKMLDFHKQESVQIDARNRPEGWANLSKGVMKDNKEKFRKGLSPSEIIQLEHRLKDLIKIFDYRLAYEKVPAWKLTACLSFEASRELLANIYRIGRDKYRRGRDIVKRIKLEITKQLGRKSAS